VRQTFGSFALILLLAVISIALPFILAPGMTGATLQSPVSPVKPDEGTYFPGLPVAPPSATIEQPVRQSAASIWTSPLPWIGLGLMVFAPLTWALVALLRRLSPDDK
jgi:hypothetical protein